LAISGVFKVRKKMDKIRKDAETLLYPNSIGKGGKWSVLKAGVPLIALCRTGKVKAKLTLEPCRNILRKGNGGKGLSNKISEPQSEKKNQRERINI